MLGKTYANARHKPCSKSDVTEQTCTEGMHSLKTVRTALYLWFSDVTLRYVYTKGTC